MTTAPLYSIPGSTAPVVQPEASATPTSGARTVAEVLAESQVEAVLDAPPQLRRSRVRAREHAHLGEIPVAELEPVDPAHPPTSVELKSWCRERLPAYKIPREFRVVDSLPETATGKLARSEAGG